MGLFPGFSRWINQNSQQTPNAESKMDTNNASAEKKIYYDENEEERQLKLWRDAEKKHSWYDAPPKVKVQTIKGICYTKIEMIVGMTPDAVYELFINPNNGMFFDMDKFGRQLLPNKSRKILSEDGPRQIAKVERAVAWDFLWWSGVIPITLIVEENKKDLTTKYKKEKMMFLKVFEGSYKVEPLYVDSERLCKHKFPKTREEYKKCSGGQGRIASKVTINQYIQPYRLLDMPPFSSYIQKVTIKSTTTLLRMLQHTQAIVRESQFQGL